MAILADTNILARLARPDDPQHELAREAVSRLRGGDEPLCIVPQNLIELWAVCTRPVAQNGLGMDVAAAQAEAERFLSVFTLLPDGPTIFDHWRRLVTRYAVLGRNVHDARIAAAMLNHGVQRILTFNGRDFYRYAPSGITVLEPMQVADA